MGRGGAEGGLAIPPDPCSIQHTSSQGLRMQRPAALVFSAGREKGLKRCGARPEPVKAASEMPVHRCGVQKSPGILRRPKDGDPQAFPARSVCEIHADLHDHEHDDHKGFFSAPAKSLPGFHPGRHADKGQIQTRSCLYRAYSKEEEGVHNPAKDPKSEPAHRVSEASKIAGEDCDTRHPDLRNRSLRWSHRKTLAAEDRSPFGFSGSSKPQQTTDQTLTLEQSSRPLVDPTDED